MSKTAEKATYAYELDVLGYVPKPLTQSIIQGILMEAIAKYEVKQTMVNTKNGYIKIDVGDINYIDITRRNLCYHLIDNSEIISVTIRKSFSTYIGAFQYNPNFLFIEPAFLINLGQIAKLDLDRVTFKNDAIVYINKKQYEKIYAAWAE